MNKTKMILAVTGGVIGLAVLVAAYFTWSAFSAKTAAMEGDDEEGTDGLETVQSKAQTLSRKPVYPCAESLREIESSRTAVVDWQKEAMKLASRGDRLIEKKTPAQFKTDIVADAKLLMNLPGAAEGKLTKPDFAFGPFKDYIVGGKMPAESELALIQRKWDDVETVIRILAPTNGTGIAELTDIAFKETKEADDAAKDKGKKAKDRGRKAKGQKEASESAGPSSYTYVLSFTTKPAGLVRALNAFVVSERFIVVEDFAFTRTKDAIVDALGGDEKKAASAASGGRRGRRGRRAEAEAAPASDAKDESGSKGRIVTDPQTDDPMAVVLTLTVRDFNSREEEEKK